MSVYPDSANQLRSPRQASNTFSQVGGAPRQRNVFIVRFVPGNAIQSFTQTLTFVVKSIDRPRVNIRTEELNQYNKRRVIFTGHKVEPIKLIFWDSAEGSAQNMWTVYSRFYFGDFSQQSGVADSTNFSYAYDATLGGFRDFAGADFGFTARNGGGDTDAQFFFDRLEIFHFYDGYFDQYNLANPRITGYEPSDLDYSNSDVATISMTVAYESLQTFAQQQVSRSSFPEFAGAFFGDPVEVDSTAYPLSPFAQIGDLLPNNPSIASLLATGTQSDLLNFRFGGSPVGGGLGLFGSFSFGPGGTGVNLSLTNMSLGNALLASALGIGFSQQSLASATNPTRFSGYSGQRYETANALTVGASGAYGDVVPITRASLASGAINGTGATVNSDGQISLSPTAMGVLNASSGGTSQFGYASHEDTSTTFVLPEAVPPT